MSSYTEIRERIAALAPHAQLLAVSKTRTPEDVLTLARAGQRDFGENYVQELVSKAQALADSGLSLRWHFIGHLQRNKVAQLLPWVHAVHSVDSVRLAETLAARLSQERRLTVFLQVNVDEEQSKSGFTVAELRAAVPELLALREKLDFRGLMVIPRAAVDGGEPARAFAAARELESELRAAGLTQGELSMGMSADYTEALAAGATWVRLGSALFGPRRSTAESEV